MVSRIQEADMKPKRVLMGQIVTVHKELWRETHGRERSWVPHEVPPRAGWVTGWRTLQNGLLCWGGPDDPNWLETKETVTCVLVVYWPTENPVRVPLYGYSVGDEPHNSAYRWSPEQRKAISEDVKLAPRDQHGRFTSWDPPCERQYRP